MNMSQNLAKSMFNQTEMNMSQYTANTRFLSTEMNYSETDDYYVLYENPGPLMPRLQSHPAQLISLLFVSCLGLVTNTISAIVWFAKVKSKSGAFFLGCLSGVDAFFCLSMAVLKCMNIADNFTFQYHIVHTIARSLAMTSRLLTLPVVAHRWVAISRPLTMTRVFALHRQVKVQACLVLSLLPIYGVLIYTDLDIGVNWYVVRDKYFWIILFSWNALFTTCLLVLNTLLLNAACRMKKIVQWHVTGTWQYTVEHRMTVIVVCMSVFSMLAIMPHLMAFLNAVKIIELHSTSINMDVIIVIFQWAVTLNSSINFVFYVCFAKEFRLTLLSMCKSVAIRIIGNHVHGQEH